MYIRVHALAGAKKELVTKEGHDTFRIQVKEPAKRNLANRRIAELLRYELGIIGEIRLISGHRGPTKVFSINK